MYKLNQVIFKGLIRMNVILFIELRLLKTITQLSRAL